MGEANCVTFLESCTEYCANKKPSNDATRRLEDACTKKTEKCDEIECDAVTGTKAKRKCNRKLNKCRDQQEKICAKSFKKACMKLKKKCGDDVADEEKAACLAAGKEDEE